MAFSALASNGALWPLVRFFSRYLGAVRGRVAQAAVLVVIAPIAAAALLWSIKILIDEVFVAGRTELLPGFALVYSGILAAKFLLNYALERLEASIVEQISQDIRVDLYRHLISVSPGSLRKHEVGDLLTHLSGDADQTEYLVYSGPISVFADVLGGLLFVGLLFLLSWKLTLCALLVVPLLALVSLLLNPRARRAARIARRQASAWMSLAEERLGATSLIHAFGTQDRETDSFQASATRSRRAELRSVAISAWLTLLVETIVGIGGLILLAVGAYEIHSGALTVGTLVAFLGSVGSLYGPVRGLAKSAGRFQRAAAGAQRVKDLLDTPSLVRERANAQPLTRVNGELEFREVEFGYQQGPPVLEGISLRVRAGETVAVVGPSGGGKTTLVRLALRLYDPAAGSVHIDGIDLRDVTLDSLRRAVAVVFQEPYVFGGSIAGKYPVWEFAFARRAARRGRARGPCRLLRGAAARRLWRAGRAARGLAVGRAAPAHCAGARVSARRADPSARRGHRIGRQRNRRARFAKRWNDWPASAPFWSSPTGCPRFATPTA